jgi:NADPH:quinone reductase-like Zn-dependent oxidoreductase
LAAGEKVLIHAGAGGVGVIAVQLAKHLGAFVATTASESNTEYVQELGADTVIDYRTTDFAEALSDYDLVFDTMGGDIHVRSYAVLKPGGRMTCLTADPIPDEKPRDDVEVSKAPVAYDTASLEAISGLVDSGAIRPQVSAVLPFSEAVSAYDLSQTGHLRGKVVLRMR